MFRYWFEPAMPDDELLGKMYEIADTHTDQQLAARIKEVKQRSLNAAEKLSNLRIARVTTTEPIDHSYESEVTEEVERSGWELMLLAKIRAGDF